MGNHHKGLNVAGDWTAVRDQLQASVPDLRQMMSAETAEWAEEAATSTRQVIDEDFADIDPDTLRRVMVRTLGMFHQIRAAIDDDREMYAVGVTQAVITLALFGQPGDGV